MTRFRDTDTTQQENGRLLMWGSPTTLRVFKAGPNSRRRWPSVRRLFRGQVHQHTPHQNHADAAQLLGWGPCTPGVLATPIMPTSSESPRRRAGGGGCGSTSGSRGRRLARRWASLRAPRTATPPTPTTGRQEIFMFLRSGCLAGSVRCLASRLSGRPGLQAYVAGNTRAPHPAAACAGVKRLARRYFHLQKECTTI